MSKPSEVKVIYDSKAIYIGAKFIDHPDSVSQQIVGRDGIGNSDYFSITIDTYNNQQSGYQFGVTASGTQRDGRITTSRGYDTSWDAIWESAISLTSDGWVVEMAIPFSAISYPKVDRPIWGLNFYRSIHRKAESGNWVAINPEISGVLNQMGTLVGLPQLSFERKFVLTPYISSTIHRDPSIQNISTKFASAYRGGLDLNVKLSESFILDMTLIPDFGQVQSDYEILNLSYSEVKYGEHRPFFNEGMELFSSGLFYTRRIGGTPTNRSKVSDQLNEGESILDNPSEASLLNATKITGRNKKNLGVGVFNAITSETYATILDSTQGTRNYLTEPTTNYNVIVFSQALRNNSSISIINTNVQRLHSQFQNANATGAQAQFNDKDNSFFFQGNLIKTLIFSNGTINPGDYNSFSFGKKSGKTQFNIGQYQEGHTYDPNDLGHIGANNESTIHGSISYHLFKPKGILLNGNIRFWSRYKQLYLPRIYSDFKFNISVSGTFKNYVSGSIRYERQPIDAHNYEEPRRENRDRKWVVPPYYKINGHFSTDGRKKWGISSGLYLLRRTNFDEEGLTFWASQWYRINDQSSLSYTTKISKELNDYGWVTEISDSIIFGRRHIKTVENNFSLGFTISKDLSIGVGIRHYWTHGEYPEHFVLNPNGLLSTISWDNYSNFNYNAFNMDMNVSWRFLPLSELNISLKNIFNENIIIDKIGYLDNLAHIVKEPQMQSLSMKLLYYFDTKSITRPLPK